MDMVENITGNLKTAYSAIERYIKKGLVVKIRNNLYSPVNLSTGLIFANKYEIACALRKDAFLSHHSALEYHGLGNQVYNTVFVSSNSRFNSFEFDGIDFKFVSPKITEGVIHSLQSKLIRLTDLERTIIDSIYRLNKITGYEELSHSLNMIDNLNEEKLLNYLNAYNIQALYQKTGSILEKYQDKFHLSNHFFQLCISKINQGVVYLIDESGNNKFNKTWQVMEPTYTYNIGEEMV